EGFASDRGDEPPGSSDPLAPRKPHFEAKAKRVIFLFMSGGPSHVDTFDPKPELTRLHGEKLPESFGPVKTRRGVDKNKLLASKRTFQKHGRSGIEVSDWFPHVAGCVDDICLLRTRGRSSAAARRRSSTWRARPESPPNSSGGRSTSSLRPTASTWRRAATTRSWPPASRPTNSPSACRRTPRRWSTSRRRPR